MLCPTCHRPNFKPNPRGRPKKINEGEAFKLRDKGLSLREIAKRLSCSLGAVQSALSRLKEAGNCKGSLK